MKENVLVGQGHPKQVTNKKDKIPDQTRTTKIRKWGDVLRRGGDSCAKDGGI